MRYVIFLLKRTAFIASKNNFVDVNILGGNGENVLHIASRTDLIWSNVSTYLGIYESFKTNLRVCTENLTFKSHSSKRKNVNVHGYSLFLC